MPLESETQFKKFDFASSLIETRKISIIQMLTVNNSEEERERVDIKQFQFVLRF